MNVDRRIRYGINAWCFALAVLATITESAPGALLFGVMGTALLAANLAIEGSDPA